MDNANSFDVGAALNTLIARSGKQKLALASHLGVSEQAVQKWIKQGTIAREHIRRICLFLGCSADELLGVVPLGTAVQALHVTLTPNVLSSRRG